MPVTKSASKALRKDRRKTKVNRRQRLTYKKAVKAVRLGANPKNLSFAFSQLDQAAKKKILHPNKVSRLKSRLSRLVKKGKKTPSRKPAPTKPRS